VPFAANRLVAQCRRADDCQLGLLLLVLSRHCRNLDARRSVIFARPANLGRVLDNTYRRFPVPTDDLLGLRRGRRAFAKLDSLSAAGKRTCATVAGKIAS